MWECRTVLLRASHEVLSLCERKVLQYECACVCVFGRLLVRTCTAVCSYKKPTSLSVFATAGQIRAFVSPIQVEDS